MPLISKQANGFTLIEILVVLFIISIVTSVALLTIGHNENKQMDSFANELMQTLSLAEEQAMLQPTVLGLTIQSHSIAFTTYELSADGKKNIWTPLQDKVLTLHTLPNGVELSLKINAKPILLSNQTNNKPQVVISTNGEITPFTLYIGKTGAKPRLAIYAEVDGSLSMKRLS